MLLRSCPPPLPAYFSFFSLPQLVEHSEESPVGPLGRLIEPNPFSVFTTSEAKLPIDLVALNPLDLAVPIRSTQLEFEPVDRAATRLFSSRSLARL